VLLLLLLLALACGRGSEKVASKPAKPMPVSVGEVESRLHKGIDVSVHSGSIDWSEVAKEGHGFAFIKATEGVDLKDPAFDGHWQALKVAGLVRGAYHFYVTEDDPEAQARFFIANVELEPGDLAPVVDLELVGHNTKEGLVERFRTFLEALETHYRLKPIIYTTAKFWDEHFENDGFGQYPLWVAEYDVDEPSLPIGWNQWLLWQWKGDADIRGVEKGADLSRINRARADWWEIVVRD